MARDRWKPVAGVQESSIFGVAEIYIGVDARGDALGSVWLSIALVELATILRILSVIVTFVIAVREVEWGPSALCGLGQGWTAVFLAGMLAGRILLCGRITGSAIAGG